MADIICPVLSCKDTQLSGLIKDPHSNAKAFDEEGYKLLTSLRIQGISKMIGIIEDLETIPLIKQPLVRENIPFKPFLLYFNVFYDVLG